MTSENNNDYTKLNEKVELLERRLNYVSIGLLFIAIGYVTKKIIK